MGTVVYMYQSLATKSINRIFYICLKEDIPIVVIRKGMETVPNMTATQTTLSILTLDSSPITDSAIDRQLIGDNNQKRGQNMVTKNFDAIHLQNENVFWK